MGRTRIVRTAVEELKKRIQIAEERKKEFIHYFQGLHKQYLNGEISYSSYVETVYQKKDGLNIQEWIEYYDDYIKECKNIISKEKKKLIGHWIFLIFSLFIGSFLIFSLFTFNLSDFGLTGFTGLFTEKIPETNITIPEIPKNISEEINEEVPQEDSSPSQEKPPSFENITEKIPKENITIPRIPKNISEEIDEEVPQEDSSPSQEEPPTSENVTEEIPEEDITISEITENITEEIILSLVDQPPILFKEISDIEIQKNTYGIIDITNYLSNTDQFFILQVENITTTTYDHRIKLVPDKEFLGSRIMKIIAINSFGETESNFFNVTVDKFVKAPTLIKEIPIIQIIKNNFTEIDITEYFAGAEQYFLLQTKNISTTASDHIIKIQPDENFIGTRRGKIIAVNPLGKTESNSFDIIISGKITEIPVTILTNISTTQSKVVINRPVKWIKIIDLENLDDDVAIELPKEAENISVKTGREIQEALLELELYENLIDTTDKEDLISGWITGNVVSDVKNSQGILTRLFKWFKGFTITGNFISEEELQLQEGIIETSDKKIIDIGKIANQTQATKIAVEYYTKGPTAVEVETKRGKKVTVSASDELNYTDVLAFTEIPEVFKVGQEDQIKIYWEEENKFVEFTAQDLDGNGKLDYVEFTVPHLSNQTFNIILITKAEHLDSNREFISNIYDEVKELDNVWSEEIPAEDYVRVTFERNLTSDRDITLYPRIVSGNPRIEVYEFEGTEIIATFDSLISNEYNKVFLTGLQGTQDVFDLRVVDGSLEFDHIIDPTELLFEDCLDLTDSPVWIIDGGANPWQADGSGGDSGWCFAANVDTDTNMTSISLNLVGLTNVSLSYNWETSNLDSNTDELFSVWVQNGTDTIKLFEQQPTATGSETHYLQDNITFTSNITIVGHCRNDANNERCKWDNINVTDQAVVADSDPPVITINSPINSTIGPDVAYDITVDEALTNAFYSLDDAANETMENDSITHYFNSSSDHPSLSGGNHNITFYANDTSGNSNTSTIFFTVDAILPDVLFVLPTPLNDSTQSNGDIYVNISSSDSNDHYAFVDFNNDLFFWMRMDDVNSSGDPTDLSSYSNNGTLTGDASIQLGGRFGSDAEFDGIDEASVDSINVSGLNADSRFNESFTVSVWINSREIDVNRDILGTIGGGSDGWKLEVTTQERIKFTGWNGTVDISAQSGQNILTANSWFHVAAVYNISVPDMKIYVDGVEATTTADVSTDGFGNALDFVIGMTTDSTTVWNGSIDEVLLFNRSLVLDEIIALNATKQYEHNFTNLSEATYTFTGYAIDLVGNKNQTEAREVTISSADNTPPDITIDSPTNITFATGAIDFNITVNEALTNALYSLDHAANETMGNDSITHYFNSSSDHPSLSDGDHNITFFANDTAGNTNTSTVFFAVDTVAPSLSNQNSNETAILQNEYFCLNATATDATSSVDTVFAEVYNTTDFLNYTMLDDGSTCDGASGDNVYGVQIQGTAVGEWNYTKVHANDSADNLATLDFADLTIDVTSANAAPVIIAVTSISATNPSEGSITTITFNFTANDSDGFADLNDSTAEGRFQLSGEITRQNLSCSNVGSSGEQTNYTCEIDMWYFDKSDTGWTVNVTIKDNADETAENSTTTFQYNLLTSMTMFPTALTWSTINLTDTNTGSDNDPIVLNNTGNAENLNINLTAYDLQGEETTTQYIFAGNFTVQNISQGCSGNTMVNATPVNVTSAILQRGNNSLNYNNATSGQEELFFCLTAVNSDITAQSYSTAGGIPWEVRILAVAFLVFIENKRKKKKEKEKEKEKEKIDKDDRLIEALGAITGELKGMKSIMAEMKEKEKVSKREIVEILESRQKENVPATIFIKEIGGLEALCKYMKENLKMSYHEIAKELSRDDRTIWASYNKAIEKQKEPIEVKETDIYIPISIFRNRNLTILESVIVHLKLMGMKNSEISKIIDRDQRNIQTIYSRAMEKLKSKRG